MSHAATFQHCAADAKSTQHRGILTEKVKPLLVDVRALDDVLHHGSASGGGVVSNCQQLTCQGQTAHHAASQRRLVCALPAHMCAVVAHTAESKDRGEIHGVAGVGEAATRRWVVGTAHPASAATRHSARPGLSFPSSILDSDNAQLLERAVHTRREGACTGVRRTVETAVEGGTQPGEAGTSNAAAVID